MQATPCALVWRFGPQDAAWPRLAAVAAVCGVTLRPLRDGDLAATVGELCDGKPGPGFAPLLLLPPTPALIVRGLSLNDGSLNTFLDMVKAAGIAFPLRAVVTPTSADWTLLHLLQELAAEHEALQR